jgi:hypothetical protein
LATCCRRAACESAQARQAMVQRGALFTEGEAARHRGAGDRSSK